MAQIQPANVDRKQYTANEGESRNGPGDVPGVQGLYYVTTGTETTIATGARVGVAGKGSVLALDSVAADGTVVTWLLFVDSSGKLRITPQLPKTSIDVPLTPGSVLQAIPMPDTNNDGTVVGP